MTQINLQFSAEDTLDSEAIRWFTAGPYSHVDWLMDDGRLLGARLEGGVAIRPADYAVFSAKRLVSMPASSDDASAFHAFCIAQLGKPYDRTAIWGFALGRDWHDGKAWFCSELMAGALENAGIAPGFSTDVWRITPAELLLIAETLEG